MQNIFRWKINGVSNQGIADRLNAEKVPSPAARKLQSGAKLSLHFRKSDEPPWSAKAVDRILHNEVYTGKLVQGKTRRLDYRSKKKMNVPMRDWTIVDNTHEAIVPAEQFELVQRILETETRRPKSGMKEREIAKKLSAQGIQTPFTRRCQLGYLKNTLRVKDPAWQTVFVTKVLENPIYTGTMVYNRIAYDETYRKIGQNPRESWRMVPDSHPAIISWELFDEISALREAEQAVKEERKKWCRQRRKNNPNIFKGRIFCKKCGEKFQPVKRDTDHLQTVMSTVEEAGDVMYLSQNVVETFIDRIEVFNDEHVKIHFTFENVLADYAE